MGYGRLGNGLLAHRAAALISGFIDDIHDKHEICHDNICRNKLCISHIRKDTHAGNMKDEIGRKHRICEKHGLGVTSQKCKECNRLRNIRWRARNKKLFGKCQFTQSKKPVKDKFSSWTRDKTK